MDGITVAQDLPGPFDRVLLQAQQVLNTLDDSDVFDGVDAATRSVFARLELFEFGLPVAQHVRLQARLVTDLAYRVVELFDAFARHRTGVARG